MKNTQPETVVVEAAPAASCYKIMTGFDLTIMETRINWEVQKGFIPVGGLTMCGNVLVQAMFKQPK